MARPRFAKLPPAQQEAILKAALDEFAAHGFHDASLNRVIDAAGISKGSMYYYFDGKEDLYFHVTRVELERLVETLGPFVIPADVDADAFWSIMESHYLRVVQGLTEAPQLASLLRGWLSAPSGASEREQRELVQATVPWFSEALAAGQAAAAVRTDLPPEFLLALVFGMGQAMDTWLVTQPSDPTTLPAVVRTLITMMRRALQP